VNAMMPTTIIRTSSNGVMEDMVGTDFPTVVASKGMYSKLELEPMVVGNI
jgi:hypothetical protein